MEPTLNVLEQGVAGPPFYTSAEGKGTIRYPARDTDRVAFSVTKEGYDPTWEDWRGQVPDALTVRLSPRIGPARPVAAARHASQVVGVQERDAGHAKSRGVARGPEAGRTASAACGLGAATDERAYRGQDADACRATTSR